MSVPTPILQYTLSDATMKGLLPSGYTPLAYIESTTSGYIDLGLKGNNNTIVTLDFVSLDTECKALFGNRSSYDSNALAICSCWSAPSLFCNWGITYDGLDGAYTSGKRYHVFINKNVWYVNGSSAKTFTSTTFTTPNNLGLGGCNGSAGGTKTRYYHCAIAENTTPKRDLKPCMRDSDGRIGMYDVIGNAFYCPSSNTFIAGPPLAVGKGGGKSLPEEYLLVEYIQSSGTQYINTGVKNNELIQKIETNWKVVEQVPQIMFGCYDGTYYTYIDYCESGYQARQYLYKKGTTLSYYMYTGTEIRTTITRSSNYSINSSGYTGSVALEDATPTSTKEHYLFAYNNNGSPAYYTKGQLREFRLWTTTGGLVRNFIPCYRKSDMKPGMYDTVNGVFYTNAGSGEFILGPTISPYYSWEPNAGTGLLSPYDSNIYVEPDGSKWIRIYHCSNPANTSNLFSSSDSFNTGVKKNDNAWFAFHMCNHITSGLWELMVKQKTTSSASEYKWRWIQYANPMTCSYSDVHNKISKVLAGQYNNDGANRGGLFSSSSNIRLRYDDNSGGGDWFGVGSWTAYQGGYPAYSATVVTSGYEDVYLRLPINGIYNNVNCIYDSSKGWVADFNGSSSTVKTGLNFSLYGSNFSIVCWLKSNVNNGGYLTAAGNELSNGGIVFGELQASNKLQCYLNGTSGADINICDYNSFAANTWYHVVYTVQNALSSPVAKLYINGSLITSASGNAAFGEPELPIIIGCNGTYRFWNGQISNFLIFNVALTDAQVKELYGK